jgi:probable phosphoglycerate mutase
MTGLRLILARHGQTDANVATALDSAPPGGPLTEEGRRQAEELADALADEPVVAVYASIAVRAQQTAAPVARRHDLTVRVIDGVQEVFIGDKEGDTDHDSLRQFMDVFGSWAHGDLDRSMPGGETGQTAIDRFTAAVDGIRERHPDGSVVVVSHGAMIRLGAPVLAPNLHTEADRLALLANTGRVVLEEDDTTPTGWRCVEWTGVLLGQA